MCPENTATSRSIYAAPTPHSPAADIEQLIAFLNRRLVSALKESRELKAATIDGMLYALKMAKDGQIAGLPVDQTDNKRSHGE